MMVGKRKRVDRDEEIRKKIKMLEEKLKKPRVRRRVLVVSSSSEDEYESSYSHASRNTSKSERQAPPLTAVEPRQGVPADAVVVSPAQPGPSSQSAAPAPPEPAAPADPQASTSQQDDVELDEVILSLLGDAPKAKTTLGKTIHKEVALRWNELLSHGIQKEQRDKLYEEYLIPANCDLLLAPTLNPEVKAALTEFNIKRDNILLQKQHQLGVALAALSRATEHIIAKETPDKVLKPLSDACRLLCDAHYQETKTRRNFILSGVKPELKDTLINSTRNQLLFGENLSEQIKSATNIQKSAEGLKITQKHPMFDKNKFIKNKSNQSQKNNLNFKGSYRKRPPGRPVAGGSQTAPQRWTRSRTMQATQHRERSPPPPPRRSPPRPRQRN